MPDPKNYDNEDDWMAACVPARIDEGDEQDQAVAACMSIWKERSAKPEKELRYFTTGLKVEKRTGENEKIVGYSAVFNKLSENLGGFREKINPGAFKNALKKSDVRALFNHNDNYVLGRQSAGTLKLKEDKMGLYMEIDPPNTSYSRDLMQLILRGDIKEQSFAFTVKSDLWENGKTEKDLATRTLMEIDQIFDVSPVTYPAYPDTSVALRKLEQINKPKFEPISNEAEYYFDELKKSCVEFKDLNLQDVLKIIAKEGEPSLPENNQEVNPSINENKTQNVIPTNGDAGRNKSDETDRRWKSIGERFSNLKK